MAVLEWDLLVSASVDNQWLFQSEDLLVSEYIEN